MDTISPLGALDGKKKRVNKREEIFRSFVRKYLEWMWEKFREEGHFSFESWVTCKHCSEFCFATPHSCKRASDITWARALCFLYMINDG